MDATVGVTAATTAARPLPVVACCVPLTQPQMSQADAGATAAVFKALADPARVRLLNLLATADEPVCVCQLTPALGLAQPTVSHHLKKLVQAGLLQREQRGIWAFYSVDRGALAGVAESLRLEAAA